MATVTLHTTLRVTPAVAAALDAWADVTGRCQRALHAGRMSGRTVGQLKPGLMRRFGLTARHFNGLRADYDGKLRAARTGQQRTLQRLVRQQARNAERLAAAEAEGAAFLVHQLRRRGAGLAARHAAARAALAQPVALCFGSARLFRAQHALAANAFADHAAWQMAWRTARSAQIPLVGSKDETAGNQSCQYAAETQALTVRLPDAIAAAYGVPTRLVVPGVYFARAPERVHAALVRGTALSYRLVREAVTTRAGRETGRVQWRVYVTFTEPDAVVVTNAAHGALGVDVNADHLAWARVDASGNPVAHGRIPLLTRGRRRAQVQADISAAVAPLVAAAAAHGVPLALEQLDFTARKDTLRGGSARRNRAVSALATTTFRALVHSKAAQAGVGVVAVNPAWSSEIGQHKYAAGYGLSRDLAAAVVIARRGVEQDRYAAGRRTPSGRPYRMRERLRGRSAGPGSARSARALPVRNRARHVWSDWGRVAHQRVRAAAAAQAARRVKTRGRPLAGAPRRGRGALPLRRRSAITAIRR